MRINNNIPALNTHRLLNLNTQGLEKSLERLSSGKRINRASDDAAGLAISQKMEAQVRGLRQASRNSLDGVSLIQTAEGALNEVHEMLQRMRELSVQGANGSNAPKDLDAIANEMKELTEQINMIGENTEFNGIHLLKGENPGKTVKELGEEKGALEVEQGALEVEKGEADEEKIEALEAKIKALGEQIEALDKQIKNPGLNLQIGSNEGQNIVINMKEFNVLVASDEGSESGDTKLKIGTEIIKVNNVGDTDKIQVKIANLTSENFGKAITIYNNAIERVSSMRSKLGAIQNRLEHTIKSTDNTAENLTAAKSRIEDLDMAQEMSEFTKLNILQQAGTSMLGQANQLPQTVLQLLQR